MIPYVYLKVKLKTVIILFSECNLLFLFLNKVKIDSRYQ